MSHVSNTYEPRLQTSRERMRLSQIRKSFDAGVKQREESKDVPVTFFVACVDYIKASMDRLHDQDQRIHDFLIPHVTNGDEHADILENLNMRLARSRDALEDLVKASAVYESSGDDGWAAFKTVVGAFMEVYFKILLSGQHSTLTLQEEVFDESTWDKVAGATPESLATEEKLYSKVKGLAPAGADPTSFIVGPSAPAQGRPAKKARFASISAST